MSDKELNEEGVLLTGLLQDVLITNAAVSIILRARCEAILEVLQTTHNNDRANQPTLEDVRSFVGSRTKALAELRLAESADEDMTAASKVRKIFDAFYPTNE